MEWLESRWLLAYAPPSTPDVEDLDLGVGFSARIRSIAPDADGMTVLGGNREDQFTNVFPERHNFFNRDGWLTGPSDASPTEIVIDFLKSQSTRAGVSDADLADFVVADQYVSQHTGVTHLYLHQLCDGLEIAGAEINANVTADGSLISVSSSFLGGLDSLGCRQGTDDPLLGASEALRALARTMEWPDVATSVVERPAFDGGGAVVLLSSGVSLAEVPAELHYAPTSEGVELAWRLPVQTADGAHWYNASVSARDGALLRLVDWADHARYNVFPYPIASPSVGDRSVVTDPHDPTASPFGWHDANRIPGPDYSDTRGNNVSAQEDHDWDDAEGFRPDGGVDLVFDFPLNLDQDPSTYVSAAVTNAFYWTNVLHDIHFQYGFDEAAGNFQVTNYSDEGRGRDPVQVDVQDGFFTDWANFYTPPDGMPPRMELSVWDVTSPNRDSAFDHETIIHEYGHGVSDRLTGGPSNADALTAIQSAGLGEGWSDWWALMLTQTADDGKLGAYPIGTYLEGQPPDGAGMRRFPYSYDMTVNPLTFDDFNRNNEIHDAGEIWASALWDLNWLLIDTYGFDPDIYHGTGGNNLALQLVMDGLKMQPHNPSFVDARDAILAADLALSGGENRDAIWTAFARRGLGFSADDGGSASATRVVEAFDLPPSSTGTVMFDRGVYELEEIVTITVRDRDLIGTGAIDVVLSAGSGGQETISLQEFGNAGSFRGTIRAAANLTQDGPLLLVRPGDVITATYHDADDGSGSPTDVQAMADIIGLIHVYDAGFGTTSGDASGFVAEGTTSQWHLSTGRGEQPDHSPEFSFYFGSGESRAGGGAYADDASGTVTSPVIDLTGVQAPIYLSFNQVLQVEEGFDHASVRVIAGDTITTIADTDVQGGLSPGPTFAEVKLDISAFAGDQIQVQFLFESDPFVTAEGWYVDDVAITAGPSNRGAVELDSVAYEVGDWVTITVGDTGLSEAESLVVTLSSTTGDHEAVELRAVGGGLFRETIPTAPGQPVDDGILQVAIGTSISVAYDDPDDGDGEARTATDSAVVLATPVELFRADFASASNEPSSDGFRSEGLNNQWHVSTGRAHDPGHSEEASYYFGSGEDERGGGEYINDAQGTLISPVIDLGAVAGSATLEFNHFLQMEEYYDTASVSIRTGDTWTVIATSDDGGLPITTAFTPVRLDIGRFLGHEIQIQFTFESDSYLALEGWYIDDVVVKGIPPNPRGIVRLDSATYEAGDMITITVADTDLADGRPMDVEISSRSGDTESVRLTETSRGVFRGSIPTAFGAAANDGELTVDHRDEVTVTYVDADDGTGHSVSQTVTALVHAYLEVFRADFVDDAGALDPDGFESSGTGNQWHPSLGRDAQPGHSPGGSFYFGAGEGPNGGGTYQEMASGLLSSPIIDLTGLDEVVFLEFNHLLDIEAPYDIAFVNIVADGKVTEIAVADGFGDLPLTTGFTPLRFDIAEYAGQQIQVQFRLISDELFSYEGWYVDDIVVRGLPIGRRGQIDFDAESYEVGQSVTVAVRDRDLIGQGPITVELESTTGDAETLTLDEVGSGRFQGAITTAAGDTSNNGVLGVAENDTITARYVDTDDGYGSSFVASDTASVVRPRIELLRVDFTDEHGFPSPEGFTSSGSNDQWHVSTGRGDDPGHSSGASFYFGTGENADGGGQYANFADGDLLSPVIDLGGVLGNVSLEFNHFLQAEEFLDIGTVSVVANGDATLLAVSDFFGDVNQTVGFAPVRMDLSDFVGQQLQIEFSFSSDSEVALEGWYIDDVVVKGTPFGPEGLVRLDAATYESGQEIEVTVADQDLVGTMQATASITTSIGDVERLTLDESSPGLFRGTIAVASGIPTENGVLEIGVHDEITVAYFNEDDGTGASTIVTETATAMTLTELFHADFSDESGDPSPEDFTVSGASSQWHLSSGRRNDAGHSSDTSFYFGSGEGPAGGGQYANNVAGELVSPVIDLTGVEDTVLLQFNHLLGHEVDYDYARVWLLADGEQTQIATSGSLGELPDTSEFTPVSFDISDYAGQPIQIQFQFTSDEFLNAEGWYVDDVVIKASAPAPTIDLNGATQAGVHYHATFTEDSGPVPIVATDLQDGLAITNADDTDLFSAIVVITNPLDGSHERLDVDTTGTSIVKRYEGHTLTLTGIDTIANYESVLRSLTYDNTAAWPSPPDRVVTIAVFDDEMVGQQAQSTVSVDYLDSGPVRVQADTFSVYQDTILEVTTASHAPTLNAIGPGVAANDTTDPLDIGDPHRMVLVDGPYDRTTAQPTGSLVFDPDGTFTFAPDAGYVGAVEFTYKVEDGFHSYGPATVSIHVEPVASDLPPVAVHNLGTTASEGGAVTITTAELFYRDEQEPTSGVVYAMSSVPTHGALMLGDSTLAVHDTYTQEDIDDNRLVYTHDGSETLADRFGFDVIDGQGDVLADQIFALTVTAVNDVPVISDVSDQAVEEDTLTDPIAFTIGDAETAADDLTVTVTSDNQALIPDANIEQGGSGSDRTVTITPAANESGSASITIMVEDEDGASASTSFTVTVSDANDPPQFASSDTVDVLENTTAVLTVTANDPNGQALLYRVSGGLDGAKFIVDSVTGALSFGSPVDFENPDDSNRDNIYEVEISADDGVGGVAHQLVFVTVIDAPEVPPTVSIVDVSPNPRASAVDSISIEFSQVVTDFDIGDVTLTRSNDDSVEMLPGGATLTTLDNITWTLRDLMPLTADSGIYELAIVAADSGITNAEGVALAAGDTAKWTHGAGDADQNRAFDQFDLIAVLRGGKYGTGEPATWREGDWNGDGVFNQFDIIVAQQTQPAHYYQGPFAAVADRPQSPRSNARSISGSEERNGFQTLDAWFERLGEF